MGCGGGCGCAPCAGPSAHVFDDNWNPGPSRLELAANPAARKLRMRSTTIGDAGHIIVLPGDVEGLHNRIDPQMRTTDAAVTACKELPDAERAAWKGFFAAWQKENETPVPLFGMGGRWDSTIAFQTQLAGWQEELRKRCSIPGPVVESEKLDLSALKWVAGAVIAVAAVYALKSVLP